MSGNAGPPGQSSSLPPIPDGRAAASAPPAADRRPTREDPTELQITGLNGFRRGKTVVFVDSPIVLGTDSACSVSFDPKWDKTVSDRHATIEWRGDSWWLVDHSREGTWIDAQRLRQPRKLDSDTEVELGRGGPRIALRFSRGAVELPAPAAQPPPLPAVASAPTQAAAPPSAASARSSGGRLAAAIIGAAIMLFTAAAAGIYAWRSGQNGNGGGEDVAEYAPPDDELLALLDQAEQDAGSGPADDRDVLPPGTGKSWAVIVGVNEYSNGINSLNLCVNDAEGIAAALRGTGTFAPERVFLLTDKSPPDLQPTSINVEKVLRTIATQAQPEDMVYFSFAGHGAWDEDRKDSYLLTSDANPQNMERTTLYGSTLRELFSQIRAQKLVAVLDACHSGGIQIKGRRDFGSKGIPDAFFEKFNTSKGQVTVRACAYDEYSLEAPEFGHGIFSYRLIEAMSGKGDADGDGIVTLTEARSHLSRTVPGDAMRLFNAKQTPSFTSGGLFGEVGDIPITVIPEKRRQHLGTVDGLRRRAADLAASDRISPAEFEQVKRDLASLDSTGRRSPADLARVKLTLRLLLGKTDPRDYGAASRSLQ